MVDSDRREGDKHLSRGRESPVAEVAGTAPAVACDFCGALPPGDGDDVPLTWLVSFDAGVARVYCDACARGHLRSIEAKLDSRWW
jgi:hypothetical protein